MNLLKPGALIKLLRLMVILSILWLTGLSSRLVFAADNVITAAYPSFTSSNVGAFAFRWAYQDNSENAIVLTTAEPTQFGAAWWENKVTLQNHRSFSAYFTFKMYNPLGDGADGLVFAIQTQSNGAGSSGGGMGYQGISPSVGIEFDTYYNSEMGDIDDNHVGIDINGITTSVASASANAIGIYLEDGQTKYAWVDYNGLTDVLEVRLSNSAARPDTALLSDTIDLESYINSADVYVGFTAGTGGSYEYHSIHSFYFNNDYIAGGITPDSQTYTASPTTVELAASPASILGNGVSASTISATAKDVSGNGMSGQTIGFSTNLGTLSAASAVTDGSGVASVTLTGTSPGTATVRGASTGGAYGETTVDINCDTVTVLGTSESPSVYGETVTFTATVQPVAPGDGTPTGTVTFKDGAATLGTANLSGGQATFSTAALSTAGHSITAVYSGNDNYNTSTSDALDQTVGQSGASTALMSSVNPSVYGQSVSFTASVTAAAPGSGTPTGTAQFNIDGSSYGSPVTLSGGSATLTTGSLTTGTHSVTVVYSGDDNFQTSTSSALEQTVNKAGAAASVVSSVNPSVYGQSVSFTASVTAMAPGSGTPTGTVQFKIDGSDFGGPITLSDGSATLTTSSLSIATHGVIAVYSGDADFRTGISSSLTQVVSKASTATFILSSQNPSVYGQPVTFTATVTAVAPGAGTPVGTVTFTDGTTDLWTSTLSGGQAMLSTAALTAGDHSITAVYNGEDDFETSVSSGLTQVVDQADTLTAIEQSLDESVHGQSVTFTATVSPIGPGGGTPAGTVTFMDGAAPLGNVNLSGGEATYTTSALSTATHSISAVYSGNDDYTASASGSIEHSVSQASTRTVITSTINPSVFGQAVTFKATVTTDAPGSGIPAGTVQFKIDGENFGEPVTLAGGNATSGDFVCPTAAGYDISAAYSGDTDYLASASEVLSQIVEKAGATVGVISAPNPSIFGQPVTFTATVAAVAPGSGTPTGTVTFKDGETTIGTAEMVTGQAALTTGSLSVGNRIITAVYSGDSNFNAATSLSLTQVVNKAATAVEISSSANPSVFGQPVTFTATGAAVAPGAGTPTGMVTFKDGETTIGTAEMVTGQAALTIGAFTVGDHSLTAEYSGSACFETSTSGVLTQGVNKIDTTTTLTSSVNPSVFGQSVTFNATVAANDPGSGTPAGTVQFRVDGVDFGEPVNLSEGNAVSGAADNLIVNSYNVTAVYSGNENYNTSNSGNFTQTVDKAGVTVNITSSLNPSGYGHAVTFTATVNATLPGAGSPAGNLTFKDGASALATVALDSGQAVFSTSALSGGTHSIAANYEGNDEFSTGTGTVSQVVNFAVSSGGSRRGSVPATPSPTPTATLSTGTPAATPESGTGTGQPDVLIIDLLGAESQIGVNPETGTNENATVLTNKLDISLDIVQGTVASNSDGSLADKIIISTMDTLPELPSGAMVLKAFSFNPSGTTFSQPLVLTLSYNPDALPEGAIEDELYIATWDGNSWIALPCTVDKTAHTVIARITHFSDYALMVPVEGNPSSPVAPVASQIEEAGNGWNIWIVIGLLLVMVSFFVWLYLKRRKNIQKSQE